MCDRGFGYVDVEGFGEGEWGIVPPFEILDAGDTFLGVGHHLTEEVGEAGAA